MDRTDGSLVVGLLAGGVAGALIAWLWSSSLDGQTEGSISLMFWCCIVLGAFAGAMVGTLFAGKRTPDVQPPDAPPVSPNKQNLEGCFGCGCLTLLCDGLLFMYGIALGGAGELRRSPPALNDLVMFCVFGLPVLGLITLLIYNWSKRR
jgi:hypothetical protein